MPSWLLVPADSVASLGTPPIRMVGAFWPASAADEEMLRAIVLPSSTVRVAGAERFGASACSLTVTLMEAGGGCRGIGLGIGRGDGEGDGVCGLAGCEGEA